MAKNGSKLRFLPDEAGPSGRLNIGNTVNDRAGARGNGTQTRLFFERERLSSKLSRAAASAALHSVLSGNTDDNASTDIAALAAVKAEQSIRSGSSAHRSGYTGPGTDPSVENNGGHSSNPDSKYLQKRQIKRDYTRGYADSRRGKP